MLLTLLLVLTAQPNSEYVTTLDDGTHIFVSQGSIVVDEPLKLIPPQGWEVRPGDVLQTKGCFIPEIACEFVSKKMNLQKLEIDYLRNTRIDGWTALVFCMLFAAAGYGIACVVAWLTHRLDT